MSELSASLEDYLECIYHVVHEKRAARVKDLAGALQVNNSSVTAALRALAERKLINYAPYDLITLTPEGEEVALDVVQRHEALRDFFVDVLQVPETDAEQAACKMEHALSKALLNRLVLLTHHIKENPLPSDAFQMTGDLSFHTESSVPLLVQTHPRALAEVPSGERVHLLEMDAGDGLTARLAAMGLLPGAEIEVLSNSNRGPFIVAVKGTRVVLGRGVAQKMLVE